MKSIYNISKGQLVTVWIFAVIGWITALSKNDYGSEFAGVLLWVIPFVVIFYSIGWKNYRKLEVNKNSNDILSPKTTSILSKINKSNLKQLIKLIGVISLLLGVISVIFVNFTEKNQNKKAIEEYVGRYERYSTHLDNAKQCQTDLVNDQKASRLASCQAEYNDKYAAYKKCRKDLYWEDHYYCVNSFGANYEELDCSEENIEKQIISEDYFCYIEVKSEYDYLVNFEKSLVDRFINKLPSDQAVLNADELNSLYVQFPGEVFNDKTKERINTYIKSKGYKLE